MPDNMPNNWFDTTMQTLGGIGDYWYNELSGKNAADYQYAKTLDLQKQAQEFNSAEAAKDRDWQKMMSDTAYQRQVADLKAAGLNPWLALGSGGSGAAAGSGASASSSAASVGQRTPRWSQLISGASQLFNAYNNSQAATANAAIKVAGIALMALMAA